MPFSPHFSPGGDVRIPLHAVIGVFDLDGRLTPPDTAELLRTAEKEGRTRLAGDDLPKSFLLLRDGSVIFSVYSAATLHERLGNG